MTATSTSFDPATWLNPPPSWQRTGLGLRFRVASGTDFWRHTHYGFCRDNGHALLTTLPGDVDAELWLRYRPQAQYDQAGLMLRVDEQNWLKTAVEHEPGLPSRLGVVVTQGPGSDWSTQDIPQPPGAHGFRLRRRGSDLLVQACRDASAGWQQLRIVRLAALRPGSVIGVGPYACSPRGGGFDVELLSWQLQQP